MPHTLERSGNLAVETTDYCNQRCRYCHQANPVSPMHGPSRSNAFMSVELFKVIVDRMAELGTTFHAFTPSWGGEPLLHPKAAELFRYLFDANVRSRFFKRFYMNTNGYYLTEEIATILLDYAAVVEADGLAREMYMTFSLDAVTPSTYSRIRNVPSSHFHHVLANIDRFLALRAQRRLRNPLLTYQCVVCEENFDELEQFLEYWKETLKSLRISYEVVKEVTYFRDRDAIFFRQRDEGRYEEAVRAKLLHEQAVERLKIARSTVGDPERPSNVTFGTSEGAPNNRDWLKRKKACVQLQDMLVISKDGTVVPCCKDLFFELKLGDITTRPLSDLWTGEKRKQLRLEQIQGKFDNYAVCSHCLNPPGGDLTLGEVVEFLRNVNRLDLLAPYVSRIYGPSFVNGHCGEVAAATRAV